VVGTSRTVTGVVVQLIDTGPRILAGCRGTVISPHLTEISGVIYCATAANIGVHAIPATSAIKTTMPDTIICPGLAVDPGVIGTSTIAGVSIQTISTGTAVLTGSYSTIISPGFTGISVIIDCTTIAHTPTFETRVEARVSTGVSCKPGTSTATDSSYLCSSIDTYSVAKWHSITSRSAITDSCYFHSAVQTGIRAGGDRIACR
jgi:hypothetical protein